MLNLYRTFDFFLQCPIDYRDIGFWATFWLMGLMRGMVWEARVLFYVSGLGAVVAVKLVDFCW